jgi:hypothetical protein
MSDNKPVITLMSDKPVITEASREAAEIVAGWAGLGTSREAMATALIAAYMVISKLPMNWIVDDDQILNAYNLVDRIRRIGKQ